MHALPSISVVLAFALAGCGGVSRIIADVPDAQKPARTVAIAVNAADKINTTAKGQPLALVTRIYKLRQRAAFEQAPFDTFLNPQREQEAFGADLIEVKEVMLIPGQRLTMNEKVSREAGYIGVVALFHTPAPQRWRLAMAAADAEKSGMAIAASACSLSAGAIPAARCQ
jgi:type VI secretion system protein VasD